MEWQEVAESFKGDGALRDIYILDSTIQTWQAVIDAVRSTYSIVFHREGTIPTDVRDLLNPESRTMLTVDPGRLDINCHFFSETTIEFDLLPNRITSQVELDQVCEFVMVIGRAARKDAILTMENCIEDVILRYDARMDAV